MIRPSETAAKRDLAVLLEELLAGRDLGQEDAELALRELVDPERTAALKAGFLTALRMLGAEVIVVKNDEIDVARALELAPTHLVVSPGPGTPERAGVTMHMIEGLLGRVPILGVCLGHQCIGEAYGGVVEKAGEIVHGKTSAIHHSSQGVRSEERRVGKECRL